MEEPLRHPDVITRQLYLYRIQNKSIYTWTLTRIASDMRSISIAIDKELAKLEAKEFKNKQALKRVRRYSKALNMLGLRFRTLTV
jgi:hypothetical protein